MFKQKKKEYNNNEAWEESENFIWAIEEYIGSCGIDGETILYLRKNDLSVGDFNENLSIEEIAEQLTDCLQYSNKEIDCIIKWLYEYYEANEMTLNELNDMCWKNSDEILNMIF